MRDWIYIVLIVLINIIFILSIVGIVIFGAYNYEKEQCKAKAELMKVEWKYGLYEECNWKINDRWITEKNYRMISE